MWITRLFGFTNILLAWPCEKIGREAKVNPALGTISPRRRLSSPPVRVVHQNAGHYHGHKARIRKDGAVATKLNV